MFGTRIVFEGKVRHTHTHTHWDNIYLHAIKFYTASRIMNSEMINQAGVMMMNGCLSTPFYERREAAESTAALSVQSDYHNSLSHSNLLPRH